MEQVEKTNIHLPQTKRVIYRLLILGRFPMFKHLWRSYRLVLIYTAEEDRSTFKQSIANFVIHFQIFYATLIVVCPFEADFSALLDCLINFIEVLIHTHQNSNIMNNRINSTRVLASLKLCSSFYCMVGKCCKKVVFRLPKRGKLFLDYFIFGMYTYRC